jgi:chemotaxis response regulator CheB
MAHILAARTAMPVAQIQHGMQIDRDHVYVIAPDTDLEVRNGRSPGECRPRQVQTKEPFTANANLLRLLQKK